MFVKLWIFDRLAASDVGVAELRAAWESVLPLRWAHQRWQLGRGVGSVWTALRYAVRVNRVGDFVVAALWLRTTALQICYLAARCMLHAMVTLGRVGSVSAATGWVSLCTAVVDDFGVFFVVNAAIFSIEQAPVPVTLGGRMRGLLDQYPRRAWIWPLGKLARADVRSWSRFKLQICEAIPTIAVIWVCARTIVALPYSLLVGFLHGESFTIFDAYRCISLRPLGRLWFTNLDDNSWRWPTVLKPWGVHRLLWKQWSAAERWSYALAWERGFALEHQQYPNDARCARAWNAHAIWGANAAPWSSAEEALPSTPQRASMPGDVQRFVIAAHACALLLIAASILGETKELNLIQRLDDVNRMRSSELKERSSSHWLTLRNWMLPMICSLADPLRLHHRRRAPVTPFRGCRVLVALLAGGSTAYATWRALGVFWNDAGPWALPVVSSLERGFFGRTCVGSIEECLAY